MKVARLYDFDDIRIEDAARPEIASDQILVKTAACGICSGDIMPWYMRRKAPLVLGHEPVGVVAEVGSAVRDFHPGQRVFVHHHAPCFECAACRRGEYVQCPTWRASKLIPGGMAEYFVAAAVNQRDTLPLPEAVSDRDGVLIEPGACVVKSLRRSGLKPGESVAIIGLGIMGMMHVLLARKLGASPIIGIDLLPSRAARGREMGADYGLIADDRIVDQVREVTAGAMADVVIVGPGSTAALQTGLKLAGRAATVVQFTTTPPEVELSLNMHDFYFNDLRLVASYSCGPDDTRQALALVQSGVLSARQLVTHSFPLARFAEAFATAQREEALKVVVTFGD